MDRNDVEEHLPNPFLFNASSKSSSVKLQERKNLSRARWDEKMGLGEIIENKGSIWVTTGIVRAGKIYCHIEELAFLMEIGALVLLGDDGEVLKLDGVYKKIVGEKYGCTWESFQAYRHLKSLGYVVGRHGILWSFKGNMCPCSEAPGIMSGIERSAGGVDENILYSFEHMRIDELDTLAFEVYKPNSKFRKSSPGSPHFVVAVSRNYPPSRSSVEALERRCQGVAPLKICYVDHGRVAFYSVEKVSIPILP